MKKGLLVKKGICSDLQFTTLRKGFATFIFCASALWTQAAMPPPPPDCTNYGNGEAENIIFTVNGSIVPTLSGNVSSGDILEVCFTLSAGADPTLFSLVSYSAPSATFSSVTADQQTVFDSETAELSGSGVLCLSVTVPSCYFQVDFVKGCVITQLGPDGTGNFYGAQGRLIDGENGGSGICSCVANADAGLDASLSCGATAILQGTTYTHNPVISWQALLGGNIVAGGGTLNPLVDAAGMYVFTVTDTLGCSASDTVMISASAGLLVDLGSDINLCAGDNVVLDAGNAGLDFMWSTGASSQMIAVSVSGSYYVTVDDNTGCSASDTVNITILPTLDVNLGADIVATLCAGSLTLDAGNPGMTYSWNTGSTMQTINVSLSGEYYVTVTSLAGCTASDTISVTVNPGSVNVDLGNDTSMIFCGTVGLSLDAGVTASAYVWNTSEITQTISVSASGVYSVTVTDSLGCMASDTIMVTIIDNSVDLDLGADTTVCGCVILSAGNPGASFLWCSGESYSQINVCTSGMYCVTVSNGTCLAMDTINVSIDVPPVVDLGLDSTILSGTLILDAGNTGASFLWSTGATTQTITVTTSGTYYVTATNASGCSSTDTVNITVDLSVADNFSPDYPVQVYPNPIPDNAFVLSFEMPATGEVEIRIVNVMGTVVYSEKLEIFKGTYSKKLFLENASGGIYFAEIMRDKKKTIKKLILD